MPKREKITIMRNWLFKFNFNVSIGENGYENDYTTVGKQWKSYINCCFSVQYDTVYNMLWTLIIFCRKKKIENNCLCFQLTMSASNESNLAVDNESAAEVACDVIINYQNEARIMVETMELMNDGWRPFYVKKRECSGERQSQRL